MRPNDIKTFTLLLIIACLTGCASYEIAPEDCPADRQKLADCPPIGAVDDLAVGTLYADRTWVRPSDLDIDPIVLGANAEIPINSARAKFIRSDDLGGLNSLAAKLYLIENAEHTLDLVYYIWLDDMAGLAIMGALCDAVERGVDVRIMVDSLGSSGLNKKYLRALRSCQANAGFMRNAAGEETIYRARVQPVIFNAASNIFININRRSHDKMLLVDASYPDKTAVMTGGRNISLNYYGINEDGSYNTHTYRDAEIFIRGGSASANEEYSVGTVSEIYYSLLFLFKNNKYLTTSRIGNSEKAYANVRQELRDNLSALLSLPRLAEVYATMPEYVSENFHDAEVRLAHELTNLTDTNVVSDAIENNNLNPNSIMANLQKLNKQSWDKVEIVSPYLFAAEYKNDDGEVVLDDATEMLKWLDDNPTSTIDIITNSVLTSDNFFTQSVIDMDLAPRLLLSEEAQEQWMQKAEEGELNPELVESEAWKTMVNHPRLRIYETGKTDDVIFGGEFHHSKLHAKYIVSDNIGFIGTTNFDYRSRLYNNEMGFFFISDGLAEEARQNSQYLLSLAYRWGSPEWLDMRRQLMDMKGKKGSNTRKQRGWYKTLDKTGLKWWF